MTFIYLKQVRTSSTARSKTGLSASSNTKLKGEAIVKYGFFLSTVGF